MAQGVLLALQLLAKARETRAQNPPLRQLQLLAPPPRVLQLVPLLAPPPRVFQALQLAAKVPVRQETMLQLYLLQADDRKDMQVQGARARREADGPAEALTTREYR